MTLTETEQEQLQRERDSWASLAYFLAAQNRSLQEAITVEREYALPAAEIAKRWADNIGWCPLHKQLVDCAHRCRDYDGYSILYTHGPIERVLDLYQRGLFARDQPGVPGLFG